MLPDFFESGMPPKSHGNLRLVNLISNHLARFCAVKLYVTCEYIIQLLYRKRSMSPIFSG